MFISHWILLTPERLILVFLTFSCVFMVPLKADTEAQIKGDWKQTADGKKLDQTITLFNNVGEFRFHYDIAIPIGTPIGQCTSSQWVFNDKFVTLGMHYPSFYNWYKQGFFTVIADGINLYNHPINFKLIRSKGTDAMVQGTWQTTNGPIYIRFLMRDNDDKLMLQVAAGKQTKIKSLKVRLLAYPQGFTKPYDRRMYTSTRTVCADKGIKLDTTRESWAMFYDEAMLQSRRARGGPCGFVYVPNEASASVDLGPYPVFTTLTAKPQKRTITLGLWDFSNSLDVKSIQTVLSKKGATNAKELAKLAKLDWNAQSLPPMDISLQIQNSTAGSNQNSAYHKMTTQVQTPHITWAKPLLKGPVNCLVVAPLWGQRETIELAQRLDLKYQTISLGSKDAVLGGRDLYLYGSYDLYGYQRKTPSSVLRNLKEALKSDHDCLILSCFEPEIIPEDIRKLFVEKVRSGTGVILLGASKKLLKDFGGQLQSVTWQPDGVPMSSLPIFDEMVQKNQPIFNTYTLGKGRILTLNYNAGGGKWDRHSLTPMLDHHHADVLSYYDYYQSLVAKSVLWVSQRELPITIYFSDKTGDVVFESKEGVPNVNLHILIDDRARSQQNKYQYQLNIPQGRSTYSLKSIGLPTGSRYLNVWAKLNEQVLGWGSTQVDLKSPSPRIQTIHLDQTVIRQGQSLTGKITLNALPEQSKLTLEIYDTQDRLLKRKTIEPTNRVIPFLFDLNNARTISHEIRASLWAQEQLLDHQTQTFTIPSQRVDDFQLVVWMDAANDAIAHGILQQLVKYGVTCLDNVGLNKHGENRVRKWQENATKYSLNTIPYITHISPQKTKVNRVRNPCLTDPKYLSRWVKTLQGRTRAAADFGPLAYSLGDENHLMPSGENLCISPSCLTNFRSWLKDTYKTIEQLNTSWQMQYTDFNQIIPATFKQVQPTTSHWPRWVDHRRFMDTVFTNAHRLAVQTIKEIDPESKVGFDGLFGLESRYGYDFYQLSQACDMVQVYAFEPAEMEYLRSWHQPGALQGAWLNEVGNTGPSSVSHTMWKTLFNGFNSSWYWMAYSTGPALLFPDLRPTPQLQRMAQVQKEIRSGIGKLLLNAQRQQDHIAVYYSQASVHTAKLLGSQDMVSNTHRGIIRLLEDAGFQYNFVSSEQVSNGTLQQYKVLVMGACSALNANEVQIIKQFVTSGGLVIADTMPGILSEHGQLLDEGPLDELFGVTRSGLPTHTNQSLVLDHAGLKTSLPLTAFDTQIKTRRNTPWALAGQTPCVLESTTGKGRTILLNASLYNYEGLRETSTERMIVQLMRRFLKLADITPPVRITTSGENVQACEIIRFINEGIEYICILKDNAVKNSKTQNVNIDFERKSFVYDVRANNALGYCQSITIELSPGEPKIFALLPYEDIKNLIIETTAPKIHAGQMTEFYITANAHGTRDLAGEHCLHVELIDPQGKRSTPDAQNILTRQRTTKVLIDLALNTPIGGWHIEVKDVLTGVCTTLPFEVISPK